MAMCFIIYFYFLINIAVININIILNKNIITYPKHKPIPIPIHMFLQQIIPIAAEIINGCIVFNLLVKIPYNSSMTIVPIPIINRKSLPIK